VTDNVIQCLKTQAEAKKIVVETRDPACKTAVNWFMEINQMNDP
jgi:hypothetical protein